VSWKRVVESRASAKGASSAGRVEPGDGAFARIGRGPWLAVLLPVLAGGTSLFFSWQRWINPFVDSGREMDVPWRLLQGERLYRNVTYYYGPLGPWLNAAALWLFGHRWVALQAVCLALSAAVFALLYRLTREAGSRRAAIAATTLGAAFCLGAPHGGAFIFPYSSSCLLALAGALLALALACRPAPARPLQLAAVAAGLAVALASRLEIGVAAAAVLVLAGCRSRPRRETLRWTLAAIAAALAIAGAQYAWALRGLSWQEVCHDGPLTHVLGMPAEWRNLYLNIAGLDRPGRYGGAAAVSALLDLALLGLLGWFALPAQRRDAIYAPQPGDATHGAPAEDAFREPQPGSLMQRTPAGDAVQGTPPALTRRRPRRYLFAVSALALLGAYLASPFADPSKNLPPLTPALPLLTIAAAAAVLLRRQWPAGGPERARFLLFGFSAALGARVVFDLGLGPRMGPYTALPLPGVLAAAAVLTYDGLAPRLPDPVAFRRRLAAVLAVIVALFFYRLDHLDRRPPTLLVQTPAGSLRLGTREALAIESTLRFLEERGQGGDTLTGFPESGFFNFVTGLRSPLRQDQVFPGVLAGKREVEAAKLIERAGPRFILLCNRPTPEYGPASFGTDYDVWLWHDVQRHYLLTATFGQAQPDAPVGANRPFIRIYERIPERGRPPLLLASTAGREPAASIARAQRLARRFDTPPAARPAGGGAGRTRPAAVPTGLAEPEEVQPR
jgi:4-amino-4-deoxy-L-arabinose transferase-like glycosyltransferase